ncbi:MAG TPA: YfiR family protein [Polyangia bacterium]|nr:YfiR family protein [Polyangia bacterium]
MGALRHIGWVVLLVVCLLPRLAHAEQVAPDKQAVILARALAYDDNLRGRAGDTLVVGVIFKPGAGGSESAADGMVRAFKALEGVKVQNLPLRVVKLAYSSKDALHSAVSSQGIDALYVCPGLEGDQGGIRDESHRDHILTIASREDQLSAGLSLGVFTYDGKTTIAVNLPVSKEEGASFSSELLRLARVIR